MLILQYLVSAALLVIGGCIALANGRVLLRRARGKASPSVVPILGGVFLLGGALLLPGGLLRPWAVFGLFLDVGCLPYLILFGVSVIRESRRFAEKNRVLSLRFDASASTGFIFVYPDGNCIYEWDAKDGLSNGSIVMRVDSFVPNTALRLSAERIEIALGVHDGTWRLDSEKGWHSTTHSLADAMITQIAAAPVA